MPTVYSQTPLVNTGHMTAKEMWYFFVLRNIILPLCNITFDKVLLTYEWALTCPFHSDISSNSFWMPLWVILSISLSHLKWPFCTQLNFSLTHLRSLKSVVNFTVILLTPALLQISVHFNSCATKFIIFVCFTFTL